MRQYLQALEYILEHGEQVNDRTGVGTKSVFGYQMRFNLQKGFPAVTTKRLAWKAVVGELLWFLEGSTDERRLAEITFGKPRADLIEKTTIWTANANKQGKDLGYRNDDLNKELGPVYGHQWRNFGGDSFGNGTDQVKWLIDEIKNNPDSRRLIISAWNPNQINDMALPPCHTLTQFRVYNGRLSCQLYQRSCDLGLGANFNQASYALLTHILAKECDLEVGDFIHTIGDAHIYLNHVEALQEQLKRKPYILPTLYIDKDFKLLDRLNKGFKLEDVRLFKLIGYQHHPIISMPMAV